MEYILIGDTAWWAPATQTRRLLSALQATACGPRAQASRCVRYHHVPGFYLSILAGLGSEYDDGADTQQISPAEMTNIVAALGGGAAADKLWTDGLHVAGERYVVFKVEDRSIYGRKVSFPFPPFAALWSQARRC